MSDHRTFIYVTREAAPSLGSLVVGDYFSCKVEEIAPAGVWYRRGDDGEGQLDFLPAHSVRTITGLEPRR